MKRVADRMLGGEMRDPVIRIGLAPILAMFPKQGWEPGIIFVWSANAWVHSAPCLLIPGTDNCSLAKCCPVCCCLLYSLTKNNIGPTVCSSTAGSTQRGGGENDDQVTEVALDGLKEQGVLWRVLGWPQWPLRDSTQAGGAETRHTLFFLYPKGCPGSASFREIKRREFRPASSAGHLASQNQENTESQNAWSQNYHAVICDFNDWASCMGSSCFSKVSVHTNTAKLFFP